MHHKGGCSGQASSCPQARCCAEPAGLWAPDLIYHHTALILWLCNLVLEDLHQCKSGVPEGWTLYGLQTYLERGQQRGWWLSTLLTAPDLFALSFCQAKKMEGYLRQSCGGWSKKYFTSCAVWSCWGKKKHPKPVVMLKVCINHSNV